MCAHDSCLHPASQQQCVHLVQNTHSNVLLIATRRSMCYSVLCFVAVDLCKVHTVPAGSAQRQCRCLQPLCHGLVLSALQQCVRTHQAFSLSLAHSRACCHVIPLGVCRHPFIFYVGHLPAFTDARLARVLQQQLIQPAHFAVMFARGIDPDLEDPTQCEQCWLPHVACRHDVRHLCVKGVCLSQL